MARPTSQYQQDITVWCWRHNGVRPEPKRAVTIHTDESAYDYSRGQVRSQGWTAKRLGEYNNEAGLRGSYHKGVDASGVVARYLNDRAGSHSTGNLGNNVSINNCFAGATAYWTREQWMKQPIMLDAMAKATAWDCAFHGIPVRKIDHNDLKNGAWGICGHWDWTKAYGGSTHWDPGGYPDTAGAFPWDHFIALTKKHYDTIMGTVAPAPAPQLIQETPDMTPEDRKLVQETNENLKFVRDQLAGIGGGGGWPQGGDRTLYDLVAAIAQKQGVDGAFDTLAPEGDTHAV